MTKDYKELAQSYDVWLQSFSEEYKNDCPFIIGSLITEHFQ